MNQEIISAIAQIAMFMVGITQLLKQFFEPENKKLKIVITIAVGAVGGILLHFLPTWIFVTLLGISVGVVFYDYILKYMEKIITEHSNLISEKEEDKKNAVESAGPNDR